MGLVSVKKFNGSIIASAVLEALEDVGVANILNTRGYILNITGDCVEEPAGYVDDEPDKHIVSIRREIKVGNKSELEFICDDVVDKSSESYKESMFEVTKVSLKAPIIFGMPRTEVNELYVSGEDCFNRHQIEYEVTRADGESKEDYMYKLLKFVADLVISEIKY